MKFSKQLLFVLIFSVVSVAGQLEYGRYKFDCNSSRTFAVNIIPGPGGSKRAVVNRFPFSSEPYVPTASNFPCNSEGNICFKDSPIFLVSAAPEWLLWYELGKCHNGRVPLKVELSQLDKDTIYATLDEPVELKTCRLIQYETKYFILTKCQ